MTNEQKRAYCQTRMEHAHECLKSAQALVELGDYRAAANRSYYAVFHAMRAANVMADIPEQLKHTGVVRKFREHYVKSGLLDRSFSNTISKLFEVRNESDYDDFFVIEKGEIEKQVQNATSFVTAIDDYLEDKCGGER